MTYGEVKNNTLELIFSDTIAGDRIAATYNCQADYEQAIPGLVNDAMVYIATTVKKIPALVELSSLEKTEKENFDIYTLPSDCWRINNGVILPFPKNPFHTVAERFRDYRLYGGNQLWMPKGIGDKLWLDYYRYPARLGPRPDDGIELDNTPETHEPIPFYVAAYLVIYDDSFRYAAFKNEFEDRLTRITEPVIVEESRTADVYDFFAGW